jgi:hypothetical protein
VAAPLAGGGGLAPTEARLLVCVVGFEVAIPRQEAAGSVLTDGPAEGWLSVCIRFVIASQFVVTAELIHEGRFLAANHESLPFDVVARILVTGVDVSHTVRYTASPGDTFPTHTSALGKSTLSLLSDDALDKAIGKMKFTQFTDATITDAKAFKNDILAGREQGYFLTRGETVADVMGISIAHRIGGEPYAIGVAGPTSRLKENLDAYLAAIKASEIAIGPIDMG